MAWAKNGTPLTLGSALDDMDITDLSGNKFNQILIHTIDNGSAIAERITCNNDGGSLYAERQQVDGVADSTSLSRANMSRFNLLTTSNTFIVMNSVWISGEEKLFLCNIVHEKVTGAGTAPSRTEFVAKYVPSPLTNTFDRIDVHNDSAGSYDTSSNISALGTD